MVQKSTLLRLLLAWALWGEPAWSQQTKAPIPTPSQTPDQQVQKGPGLKVEVTLVDVLFTVFNRRQKLVTDLEKTDFRVLEDGRPQEIRYFSRQTDLPLRVGLLLDTSNSIRDRMKFEQEAAIDFLFGVIRRKKDQAFLMTFDNEPSVIQRYTDDVGALRDAIMRQRAGGGTALYDAIYVACRDHLGNPPRPAGDVPPDLRRVLVVISDGDDNLSTRSRSEAVEMALGTGVVIYAISTSTQWVTPSEETDPNKKVSRKYHKDEGDRALEQLADETGGRAFFPYRVDDLAQSFLDIGDELRSQYSLAYIPTNKAADGGFRKIRIEVDRKGLVVRHRKGYHASRASAENGPAAKSPDESSRRE